LIGYNSNKDKKFAYLFEEPLVFTAGEELNIYINTAVSAGGMNFTEIDLEIAMILKYKKVE